MNTAKAAVATQRSIVPALITGAVTMLYLVLQWGVTALSSHALSLPPAFVALTTPLVMVGTFVGVWIWHYLTTGNPTPPLPTPTPGPVTPPQPTPPQP